MKTMVVIWLVMMMVLPSAEGMSSWPPTCCTELGKKVPPKILKFVKDVMVQKDDGACYLKAIVLRFKWKSVCIDPENEVVLKWLCKEKKYRKLHDCSSQHFHAKKVKPGL